MRIWVKSLCGSFFHLRPLVEMAVKMTVKVRKRKRKSNSMRLPTAVRIAEITSKRLQFFKIFLGSMPTYPPRSMAPAAP